MIAAERGLEPPVEDRTSTPTPRPRESRTSATHPVWGSAADMEHRLPRRRRIAVVRERRLHRQHRLRRRRPRTRQVLGALRLSDHQAQGEHDHRPERSSDSVHQQHVTNLSAASTSKIASSTLRGNSRPSDFTLTSSARRWACRPPVCNPLRRQRQALGAARAVCGRHRSA